MQNMLYIRQHVGLPHTQRSWGCPMSPSYIYEHTHMHIHTCKSMLYICQHMGLPHTPKAWGCPTSP